jgi:hypothetical protein
MSSAGAEEEEEVEEEEEEEEGRVDMEPSSSSFACSLSTTK